MKKLKIVIIGAGDGSNEILDLLTSNYKNFTIKKTTKNKINFKLYDKFLISLGDPQKRAKIFSSLSKYNSKLMKLIDKRAYVSTFSKIGKGTIIFPNTTIGYNVKIGRNCYIGANCSIGHDVLIGDHCVLAPGTLIGGSTKIGSKSFLSLGSTITPYLKIGSNTKISAREVLYKDLPPNSTFIGSRILKN